MRLALLVALVCVPPASAETWFWVDADGVTHISDDPAALPAAAEPGAGAGLAELWGGVPVDGSAVRARATDRVTRVLRGAVDDLERGETARAAVALESALRMAPGRPEAHWLLARLDRERGHYESAASHLRAFLAGAGDSLEPWRRKAELRLRELEDELRLASAAGEGGDFVGLVTEQFRIRYDAELGRVSPGYPQTVLRHLEAARAELLERLGALPAEAMGVVLYGKAAYLRAHRHRFSFETVGFFDGRIHVVSAAHPERELRDLLFHEYSHAIFRERTGGDRPFWLNEGLAELAERERRSGDGLSRGERVALHARLEAGDWIPLPELAQGFSGLDNQDARAAYLESTAAAAWIEQRTDRAQRARLLARLGAGEPVDRVLRGIVGTDSAGVDAGVRARLRSEFPER